MQGALWRGVSSTPLHHHRRQTGPCGVRKQGQTDPPWFPLHPSVGCGGVRGRGVGREAHPQRGALWPLCRGDCEQWCRILERIRLGGRPAMLLTLWFLNSVTPIGLVQEQHGSRRRKVNKKCVTFESFKPLTFLSTYLKMVYFSCRFRLIQCLCIYFLCRWALMDGDGCYDISQNFYLRSLV